MVFIGASLLRLQLELDLQLSGNVFWAASGIS